MASRTTSINIAERFWSKVNKSGVDDCWNWISSVKDKDGYGRMKIRPKHYRAHRLAYALNKNIAIEEVKLNILHSCDNPSCCNPKHLREGTEKENTKDMIDRGRQIQIGEGHNKAKLRDDQIIAIRNMAGKILHRQLAALYGVHQTTIERIVGNKMWRHLV
jgi:HNH endonuclease